MAVADAGPITTRRGVSVFVVFLAFASMLFGANLATPLYAGYSERFGFSTAVLALVFAVYALVLVPSLLLFGQMSDRFGRRRVIAAGLVTAVVALGVFAFAQGLGWLFTARALQGLAQGMMSGAATAALAELLPGRGRRAALLATLAQAGGSALGPIVSGVLAEWAPAPHVLPYLPGVLVCLLAIALLPRVPETATSGAGAWRVRRPEVPAGIRAGFARVALTAAVAWSVAAGLFLAIIPSYAGKLVLHTGNLAVLGAATGLMLLASCAAQFVTRRGGSPAVAQAGGLGSIAAGLAALVAAAPTHSAVLLFVGAVLAGAGHGAAFLAAQQDLTALVPDDRRAEVAAAFYVCIYLGVALPVIGIGVLAATVSLFTGVAVFAAVTGTGALAVAAWHWTSARRS